MPTRSPAAMTPPEAVADLLALLLVPAGQSTAELLDRLAALDAFARLGLDRQHVGACLDQAIEQAAACLRERSWLDDGDRARIDGLLAAIDDPATRARLCQVADAVLGEDDSVCHSRRLVLDHVVSAWHIALPHAHAAGGGAPD